MKKALNVLIVEDHPMVIEVYQKTLTDISKDNISPKFNITTAMDCESANFRIDEYTSQNPLHLALLDLSLPASKDGKFISGDDLGQKIKKIFPNCKTIVITSLTENFRLNTIFKKLSPVGLLIKSDASVQTLKDAILSVLEDDPYYSSTILKLLRKQISNDFILENIDRQILYHLSIGTKTKDLPTIVNLSIGGVERRKRKLKNIFDLDGGNDDVLLQIAKENGFI